MAWVRYVVKLEISAKYPVKFDTRIEYELLDNEWIGRDYV